MTTDTTKPTAAQAAVSDFRLSEIATVQGVLDVFTGRSETYRILALSGKALGPKEWMDAEGRAWPMPDPGPGEDEILHFVIHRGDLSYVELGMTAQLAIVALHRLVERQLTTDGDYRAAGYALHLELIRPEDWRLRQED